jgi:Tfp pilus assembly protein PilF
MRHPIIVSTGALALACLLAGPATAQFGRVTLLVSNAEGSPVAGAEVDVECEKGLTQKRKSKKDGKVTFAFADATQSCVFRVSAEGYGTRQVRIKPPIGETLVEEVTLLEPTVEAMDVEVKEGQVARYTPAQVAFNAGAEALRAGDLEIAEAKFEEALELDDDLAEVPAALAVVYKQREEWEAAIAAAKRSLEVAGESPQMYRILYESYRALGNEAEATAAREALAALGQGRDSAAFAYNEGVAALQVGDDATAEERFEEALSLDSQMGPALLGLAAIRLRQGALAEAVELCERLLALEAQNETALRMRWQAYQSLGDEEKAEAAFADLAAADPTAVAEEIYTQAVELFEAGNSEAALDAFRRVVKIDPDRARTYYYLGLCYVNLGETAMAKENLQKFIDMAPDDPEVATANEMLSFLQ